MRKYFFFYTAGLAFALLLMSHACENAKERKARKDRESQTSSVDTTTVQPKKELEMLSFKFDGDYTSLWKRVDSLQNLGLYRSALDVVQIIFNEAQMEENAPQVIKAVIHKMKYNSYLAEDDYILALDELNSISKSAEFPLKQIVHSVTAEVYWTYYQNNRWKFINRTQTVNFVNADVRTWDLNKIADHVNKHYMLSLTSPDSLQHTNIADFKEILVEYNESAKQRPTLYDFLAHRALNFFESTESGLSRPAEKYIISGQSYFDDAEGFVLTSTVSSDSMSNALHATKIFIELTKFHIHDKTPEAFVDLELRRLKYARSYSTEDNKEELYINALNKLAEKFKDHESYAEIRFYSASYYNQQGEKYTAEKQELKWEKKKALEICNEAISRFPDAFGAKQCEGLKETIEAKTISFNTEMAYQPKSTGKMLMSYKNVDSLYFKVVKVNWDYFLVNRKYGDELIKDLLSRELKEEWSKKFTNPGDYQSHSTEILVSPKDFGQYVVLASPNKDFKMDHNAIAYGSYWVSNISFNYRTNDDQSYGADYFW